MFKRLKLLHAAWKLTNKLSSGVPLDIPVESSVRAQLTSEDLKKMLEVDLPLGDGGAVFFSEATEEEFQRYIRDEENGWKKFKDMFKRS